MTQSVPPNTQAKMLGGRDTRSEAITPQIRAAAAEVELRSEAYNDVISAPPSLIIRSGGIMAAISTVVLISLTAALPYNDQAAAVAAITTQNGPISAIAETNGYLHLYVQDGDWVEPGARLAVISGAADYDDVVRIQQWLTLVKDARAQGNAAHPPILQNANLGSAQHSYVALLAALAGVDRVTKDQSAQTRISYLENERQTWHDMTRLLASQIDRREASLSLTTNQVAALTPLIQKKRITQTRFDQAQQANIEATFALESANMELMTARTRVADLSRQIEMVAVERSQEMVTATDTLDRAIVALEADLAHWDTIHVIRAKTAGYARLFEVRAQNQRVAAGDEILSIDPGTGTYQAVAYIPARGLAKVHPGQTAYVALDSHNSMEFGKLVGEVSDISTTTREGKRRVTINLPKSLETTHGHEIEFRQNMGGQLEVITEPLSLMQRIFYQIRHVWSA